ncbi:Hsp20/alpha crystallin family protein [Noviherbaspirillum massiliense]|uniref:Hsp20/alpha crystallin family protein n=1 Tax=Noviherbaspirillum massiliense TaxID=1465823 RepID=UPI000306532C|nr:Hsp20/alpha crystallin family protein [Noviherbaspirillum massiliense]
MKWRDPTISIWDEALDMLERADRLHRQFFQLEHQGRTPTWEPPVDVFETELELVIITALPGVAAEQLAVTIEGPAVVIRGQRAMPLPRETAMIRRLEIPYGQFERRVELPPGQFQVGQRLLKDGCLILTLNKLG